MVAPEMFKLVQLPKNFDIFPAERQNVISEILSTYEKAHSEHRKSVYIMRAPYDCMVNALSEKYFPKVADVVVSTKAEPLATTKETRLRPWIEKNSCDELDAFESTLENEEPMDAATKKVLIACVQAKLYEHLAKRTQVNDTCNTYVKTNMGDAGGNDGKPEIVRLGEGNTKLPFFGKVIDGAQACNANRALLLPLGDNAGEGWQGCHNIEW